MEEILNIIREKVISIDGFTTILLNVSGGFIQMYLLFKYRTLKLTKLPNKVKIIRVLGFILAYIIPSIMIISLIINAKRNIDLRTVLLFILNCFILFFNILIPRINSYHRMIKELAEISSDKLSEIDSTFTNVYNQIEKIKKDNKLK